MRRLNVKASVSSRCIYANEAVRFRDSTIGAYSWKWEFGDGGHSDRQKGEYVFSDAGRYRVRLTLNGNKHLQRFFDISVLDIVTEGGEDHNERMKEIFPDTLFLGEYIVPARWGIYGPAGCQERTDLFIRAEGFGESNYVIQLEGNARLDKPIFVMDTLLLEE